MQHRGLRAIVNLHHYSELMSDPTPTPSGSSDSGNKSRPLRRPAQLGGFRAVTRRFDVATRGHSATRRTKRSFWWCLSGAGDRSHS